jgi:hypothetical protein
MAFKMKGYSYPGTSPMKKKGDKGKNYESSKGDMQGPIPEKNIPLQEGEMDGTYTFGTNYGDEGTTKGKGFNPTGTKGEQFTANERINDMEERAGFLTDNDLQDDDKYLGGGDAKKGAKVRKTKTKTANNLNREAQIMRDRRKNLRKK